MSHLTAPVIPEIESGIMKYGCALYNPRPHTPEFSVSHEGESWALKRSTVARWDKGQIVMYG